MWNQVKNDPEKYDKTVLNLKATAGKEKIRMLRCG